MDIDYCLRKARKGEEDTVYTMIADRVEWMNNNDIHQWNDTDYLKVYPLDYYCQNIDRLYVLTEKGKEQILCAAILLSCDERWKRDRPAIYIHNFVSSLDSHGAGEIFIEKVCELAKEEGISYLRLDSAKDNRRLASYYTKLGFEPCGVCRDGDYHGILRQKKIQ